MNKEITTSLMISKEQNEKLLEIARELDRSKGYIVRMAVEKFLEEKDDETTKL